MGDVIVMPVMRKGDSQHNAHVLAYLDFWCAQFERKVRSRSRERMEDDKWDRENGGLNA